MRVRGKLYRRRQGLTRGRRRYGQPAGAARRRWQRRHDGYSALAPFLPHVLRTFRREPALALTVAYLLVAMAGIYYDYWFYQRNFGIPVLTLSQISDFLVAGLQQPTALALVVLTLPVCWILDRNNVWNNRAGTPCGSGSGRPCPV